MSSPALRPETPFQNEFGPGVNVVQIPGALVYMLTALSGLTVPLIVWMSAELNRMKRDSKLAPLRNKIINDWMSDPSLRALLAQVNMSGTDGRFLEQLNKISKINRNGGNSIIENNNLTNSLNKYKTWLTRQISNKEKALNNAQGRFRQTTINKMRAELNALRAISPNRASGNWTRALQSQGWTENSVNSAYNPYKFPGFLQFLADEAKGRQNNIQGILRSQWTALIHFIIAITAFIRMIFIVTENSQMLLEVSADTASEFGKRITDILKLVALVSPTVSRQGVEQMLQGLESRTGYTFTPRGRAVSRFIGSAGASAVLAAAATPVSKLAMNTLVRADNTYREIITFMGTTMGRGMISAITSVPWGRDKTRNGARAFRNSLEGLSDTLYSTTIGLQGLMLATAAVEFHRVRGMREEGAQLLEASQPVGNLRPNQTIVNNTGPASRTRSAARGNRRERLTLSSPLANYANAGGNRNNSNNIPVAGPANMRSPNTNNNFNNNR